jgi:hypothetical protein
MDRGCYLTKKGSVLLGKLFGAPDVPLIFSRITGGSGVPGSTDDATDYTDLISPEIDSKTLKRVYVGNGIAKISGTIINYTSSVGFNLSEGGLFAMDPQEGEILFCYMYLGGVDPGNPGVGPIPVTGADNPSPTVPVLEFVTHIGAVQLVQVQIGLDDLVTYQGLIDYTNENCAAKSHTHDADEITGVLSVEHGGTGASNAADAVVVLGLSDKYLPINRTATNPTGTTRYNCEGYLYATRLYGAVYNDYAEEREAASEPATVPGTVVEEIGGGILDVCAHDRSRVAYIVSDTYGTLIGAADGRSHKAPVALAGRVLARVYGGRDGYRIGDALCAKQGGVLRMMSEQEIRLYPLAPMAVVTDVPLEDEWNGVKIDGRVWVKVLR